RRRGKPAPDGDRGRPLSQGIRLARGRPGAVAPGAGGGRPGRRDGAGVMSEKPSAVILVVDDTEATRYAVGRILREARYTVLEAATGTDALRLLAERPDLVLLDVNLPDANGYELCRRIKADPATASISVLHLSASFVESEDRSHGLEHGADGYLVYPLAPRELLAQIRALLRAREAEKAARGQRELLHVTLSSIGEGVIAADARGVVPFINPVAQTLLGRDEAS